MFRLPALCTFRSREFSMAAKSAALRPVLLATIMLLGLAPVKAQFSDYFLDAGGFEPRFVQRLSWLADEFVLRFEVIIEREEAIGFRQVLREYTVDPFIEVSLSPGRYRYRVIPHDFLARPGPASQWVYFEIRAALNPILEDFSPAVFYTRENAVHELNIFGNNLVSGGRIYLRRFDGLHIAPFQVHIHADGRQGRLLFSGAQLLPGHYALVVINPGGLETIRAGITFTLPPPEPVPEPEPEPPLEPEPALEPEPELELEPAEPEPELDPAELEPELEPEAEPTDDAEYQRLRRISLGLAWMPLFPISGESHFIEADQALSNVGFRAGFISSRERFINLGVEFATSWYLLDTVQAVTWDFNVLTQSWLPNERVAFNLRLGAGISMFTDTPGRPGRLDIEYVFNATMGFSFLWLLGERFHLETGIDFINMLTEDQPGWMRPWVGMGWRIIEPPRPQPDEPDGLLPEYTEETDEIEYRRLPTLYVNFAWVPRLPIIAGEDLDDWSQAVSGAGLRLGFLSSRQRLFNHGMEAVKAWHIFDGVQSVTMDLNLLARRWISAEKRTAVTLRFGAGLSLFPGYENLPEIIGRGYSFHANMGFSLLWMLGNSFHLETGIDYVNLFTEDQAGWVRPWLGMGWRLSPQLPPPEQLAAPPPPRPLEYPVALEYRTPPNLYASFAWLPLSPLYTTSQFFGRNPTLSGLGFRLGFLSAQDPIANFGLEFGISWHIFYEVEAITLDFNFMIQRWLSGERLAFNVRFGAGFSMLAADSSDAPELREDSYSFNPNIGLSLLWLLGTSFFMEAGFDYIKLLSTDQSGWVRPWLGAGWRR